MNAEDSNLSDLSKEDQERVKKGVEYTNVNQELLDERQAGTDFKGNMTEFSLLFEWKWVNDEEKYLHEKSTDEKFSGWIHIKDERLDEDTYPGQEQKIKFANGVIKFMESLNSET